MSTAAHSVQKRALDSLQLWENELRSSAKARHALNQPLSHLVIPFSNFIFHSPKELRNKDLTHFTDPETEAQKG